MEAPSLAAVEARLFESVVADPWGELPATLDEAFLAGEIGRRDAQLEAVDTALTARIRGSYGAFMGAMQEIRLLEEAASRSAVVAAAARGHLGGLEAQLVGPALRMLRSSQRLARHQQLLAQCASLDGARKRLVAARELLERQQFGECLEALARLSGEDKSSHAMRALCAEGRAMRDEVVATLKGGEGYLGRLVSTEQWDEGRFLRYMEALQSAGDEFATTSARVQVVHRTLLRNADRNIGGGSEMKVEEMKSHFNNMSSTGEYLEAARLCFLHVSVALRLQVCVSRAALGKAEQLACASLRPKFWAELCRRVNAVLASKTVYALSVGELLTWHRLAGTVLELGRAYCGEESEQHAKLLKSVLGVLQRYVRHRHSLALARLRIALCDETWETLAVVPHRRQTSLSSSLSGSSLYDPAVHNVMLPGPHWRSPFADTPVADVMVRHSNAAMEDEEEDAALRGTHVEEGDELLFREKTPQPQPSHSQAAAETRLLSCEAGRVCIAVCDEYLMLLEGLPDSSVLSVLRALQSLWRYFVVSVWSFFLDASATTNVSEGLQRMQQQARSLLADGGAGGGGGGGVGGVGGEILDLFGSGEKPAAAVVTLRKRDENDVDYVVMAASLSPGCDLQSGGSVYGMQARCVAAETVWSVSAAMQRTRLARLAAHPQAKRIEHFYEAELGTAAEIRDILFERCTASVVLASELQRGVAACVWSDAEASTQLPAYLGDLNRRMRQFASHLKKEGMAAGPSAASLWSYFVAGAMSALLNGFAAVKKCDDVGRAQMLTHLNLFAAEVAKLTALRPLPLLERTRSYLNAYFEKEAVMRNFIEQFHYQYDEALLVSLLNCAAPKMSRKDRATALQKIKEWKAGQ